MSGTLVHMGTRVPAGTHRNLENLGTAGYRVLARKKFWVPMGTGYRENFHLCRPLVSIATYLKRSNSPFLAHFLCLFLALEKKIT